MFPAVEAAVGVEKDWPFSRVVELEGKRPAGSLVTWTTPPPEPSLTETMAERDRAIPPFLRSSAREAFQS